MASGDSNLSRNSREPEDQRQRRKPLVLGCRYVRPEFQTDPGMPDLPTGRDIQQERYPVMHLALREQSETMSSNGRNVTKEWSCRISNSMLSTQHRRCAIGTRTSASRSQLSASSAFMLLQQEAVSALRVPSSMNLRGVLRRRCAYRSDGHVRL